jgi:sec-independent protein translocase protein TatC
MEQVTSFSIKMLLAFGLVFELPLVLSVMAFLGVVTARTLWRFNRYALVISAILGALLTPGPDVMSMLLMTMPMWMLYNVSVGIAYLFDRRRAQADPRRT